EDLPGCPAQLLDAVARSVNPAGGRHVSAEVHAAYDRAMAPIVRMAPSPTGWLHIGLARTFLFNWLFARQQGGECRLRIENTDINREVAEATEQIQRSLRWRGIEWDGDVTFQLDRLERCQAEARRLVEEDRAY